MTSERIAPDAPETTDAASVTPTLRARLRQGRVWGMIGVVALLTVLLGVAVQAGLQGGAAPDLDPESPDPNGARAVAQVLEQEGVAVRIPDADEALDVADPATTTVLVHERDAPLSDAQIDRITTAGFARVVLLRPSPDTLRALEVPVDPLGVYGGDTDPAATIAAGSACPEPLRTNAPTISRSGGGLYGLQPGAAPGSWSCYPIDGAAAVVSATVGDTAFVVVGAVDVLRNDTILTAGDAAFALDVLGSQPSLEWVQPEPAALAGGDESFVPDWVTPAMLLLLVAGVMTLVWRGRRFGPLVVERLPVVVPAAETMEGRARLYARSHSSLRALDSLRVGALARLGVALSLPAATPPDAVADAVAATTGRRRDEVRMLLVHALPRDDRDLVELSRSIQDLEDACRAALVPDSPHRPTSPNPRNEHRP